MYFWLCISINLLLPFLYTGMILPIFRLSGNIPVVRHWFIINVNDGLMMGLKINH